MIRTDGQTRVRALIADHTRLVTRTLRRCGVASRDLDDGVQRTFICAARHLDEIRPGCEGGYLFSIATKVAATTRRTYARRREILSDEALEPTEATPDPESLAAQRQTWARFERVLDGLDESLRSVFVLHTLEELGSREAAAILGIPRGTAASRLRRARAELRARLASGEGRALTASG